MLTGETRWSPGAGGPLSRWSYGDRVRWTTVSLPSPASRRTSPGRSRLVVINRRTGRTTTHGSSDMRCPTPIVAKASRPPKRIRPALQRLHDIGDFTYTSTHYTLLSLGFPDSAMTVQPMHTPADSTTPPPGAAFGVRVGPNACVIGSVEPAKVIVEVAGAAGEYGCLEPYSH